MPDNSTDFKAIFEQSPVNYVVVNTDWTIVAATDGYLSMAKRTRENLLGRNIFDAFPDDPDDPKANGTEVLRSGLEHARDTKKAEWLPGAQRYPIQISPEEGGGFEERWFRAINAPILDRENEVRYLIHGNEDVTDQMQH